MGLNKSVFNDALMTDTEESKGAPSLLIRIAAKQTDGDDRQIDTVNEISQEKEQLEEECEDDELSFDEGHGRTYFEKFILSQVQIKPQTYSF